MHSRLIQVVALVSWCLLADAARAGDFAAEPWEKFGLMVGGFMFASDTEARVDSAAGIGTSIDLEKTLGIDENLGTYRIGLMYRFGKQRRHQIDVHYFDSARSGAKTLTEDVEIDGKLYPAGTSVNSDFDLRFINFDYAYAFLQDDRVRLALSAGLHLTDARLRVTSTTRSLDEDEALLAPLPVIGLRAEMVLTPRWRFKTNLDLMYLEISGFEGRVSDLYLGVEYLAFRNLGFGFGANSVRYRIEGDGNEPFTADFRGVVQFDLNGAIFYLRYFY
jgi:hypothetical protein